jgi:hypothetical protein
LPAAARAAASLILPLHLMNCAFALLSLIAAFDFRHRSLASFSFDTTLELLMMLSAPARFHSFGHFIISPPSDANYWPFRLFLNSSFRKCWLHFISLDCFVPLLARFLAFTFRVLIYFILHFLALLCFLHFLSYVAVHYRFAHRFLACRRFFALTFDSPGY